jgi:hypothetical protein
MGEGTMNKILSTLAVLSVGGAVLANGIGVASAAPAARSSDPAKPHQAVRTTSAAQGKSTPLSSVTTPQTSVAPNATKVRPNDVHVAKVYNFYSYRALDADADSINRNGTRIQLWDDLGAGQANQSWSFTSTDTAGLYKITNNASGRALDADADSINRNGTRIQLWDDLGTSQANQLWWLVDTGYHDADNQKELYKWVNYASNRVLDADLDGIANNGTRVQLWDNLGVNGFNQDWEF